MLCKSNEFQKIANRICKSLFVEFEFEMWTTGFEAAQSLEVGVLSKNNRNISVPSVDWFKIQSLQSDILLNRALQQRYY